MTEFKKPQPKQPHKQNPIKIENQKIILEEDEYLQRMEKIIKRDFYPDLVLMEKFQAQFNINSKSFFFRQKGFQYDNCSENASLNDYQSNYNSEDNSSLQTILKQDQEKWNKNHKWMFELEQKHNDRQQFLAIQNEESKIQNMIEGNRSNQLAICEYSAKTNFFFQPDTTEAYQNIEQSKAGQIQYNNTRIEDTTIVDTQALQQQTANIKQKDNSLTNQFEEYDLIPPPSPHPDQFKSPLITWGEIQDTPIRVDRFQFRIQNKSQREITLGQIQQKYLNKKNVQAKKKQKEQQNQLYQKLNRIQKLLSTTPKNRIDSVISQSSILSQFSNQLSKKFIPQIRPTSFLSNASFESNNSKKIYDKRKNPIIALQTKEDELMKKKKITDNLLKF